MVKIDESICRFIEYQQNADKEFFEMERERERGKKMRERKEDGRRIKTARVLKD